MPTAGDRMREGMRLRVARRVYAAHEAIATAQGRTVVAWDALEHADRARLMDAATTVIREVTG